MDKHAYATLCERKILPWLGMVMIDWSIIISCFIAFHYAQNSIVFWLLSLVVGNRLHALAGLGHDGGHRLICRNKLANDFLTNLFVFYPMGVSLQGYRKFHMEHHRTVGTDQDPELIHKNMASPDFNLPFSRKKIAFLIVRDLFGYGIVEQISIAKLVIPDNKLTLIIPVLTQLLFIGFCIGYEQYWIAVMWYYASISSFWVCMRLRIWIEHIGTEEGSYHTHRVSLKWWQRMLFAPHGLEYHYEHHKYPAVPAWKLSKIRKIDTEYPLVTLEQLLNKFQSKTAQQVSQFYQKNGA